MCVETPGSQKRVTMGKGEDDKKEGAAPCQLLPGGFAGTGPNGSFFETPGWVDKVRLSVYLAELQRFVRISQSQFHVFLFTVGYVG